MSITEINQLEHDPVLGYDSSLVKIDATHFILAYAGVDSDGFIKTFSVDALMDNITEIDSLEHDTTGSGFNSIVKIDSTHFILAYQQGANGIIKTFSIDGAYGTITQIDSLTHEAVRCFTNSLIMIDSTHFALAYQGVDNDGYIKTFSIDGAYGSITQIDSLEHDIIQGKSNSLVLIDATHFILAYSSFGGGTDSATIKTFSIDGSYGSITVIDTLIHDVVDGEHNSLIMIDSTHFAVAYSGVDDDGFIKTFSIDGSYGSITEIDSLEHETAQGNYTSLILVDSTHFMLAYTKLTATDNVIKAFEIDSSYIITQTDTLTHDSIGTGFSEISLILMDGSTITNVLAALAYTGGGDDGFIVTFNASLPPPPTPIAPTVATQPLTAITATTATGNGIIADLGEPASVTEHGHCWATSIDPTTADSKTTNGAGSLGAFISSITGLVDDQVYFVRAYATNATGTAYGANAAFRAGSPGSQLVRGNLAIKQTRLHYVDADGKERWLEGALIQE